MGWWEDMGVEPPSDGPGCAGCLGALFIIVAIGFVVLVIAIWATSGPPPIF